MKAMYKLFNFLMLIVMVITCSHCSSTNDLQKNPPFDLEKVYYESWTSGVSGGGSGINVFIELKKEFVQLDSVYFRGKVVNLEVKPSNKRLFIGRLLYPPSNKFDRTLDKESLNEYKNKAPIIEMNTFYNLEQDECVVTYESRGKTKYYKITSMVEKRRHDVPMAPAAREN
mgnify:CR=1 FL=1